MQQINPTGHTPTQPADEYREGVRVKIKPGEARSRIGMATGMQLVRLILTDNGPISREDDVVHHADVICTLCPRDARRYAIELLNAAEEAEELA